MNAHFASWICTGKKTVNKRSKIRPLDGEIHHEGMGAEANHPASRKCLEQNYYSFEGNLDPRNRKLFFSPRFSVVRLASEGNSQEWGRIKINRDVAPAGRARATNVGLLFKYSI